MSGKIHMHERDLLLAVQVTPARGSPALACTGLSWPAWAFPGLPFTAVPWLALPPFPADEPLSVLDQNRPIHLFFSNNKNLSYQPTNKLGGIKGLSLNS